MGRGDWSPRAWARLAGVGYLVIIGAGIFAEFAVRQSLVVRGDAAATAANIVASGGLYRLGLVGDMVMLGADVLVAAALYVVFAPFSRGLALLAAFFRLAHAAVYGVMLLVAYTPLLLLGEGGYLAAFPPDRLQALALLLLEAHAYGYALALVFFGFHCLVLGHLAFWSRYVPRTLGVLLGVAGLGYLADALGRTLLADYYAHEMVFGIAVFGPAVIAELSFALWLVVRGVQADPVDA